MLSNLQVCFNAVMPLFLIMGLGYGVKCLGGIRVEDVPGLNKMAFRFFMPVMLFWNLYTSSIDQALQPKLLLFAVGATLVMYGLSLAIVLPTEKDYEKQGVKIQGMYRSNLAIIGLPLATVLVPGADMGPVAMLAAIIVPLFNVLAVITLTAFRGERLPAGRLIKMVATNPLILGSAVGLVFLGTGWRLPTALESAVHQVAAMTSPFMLFLLGAFFRFSGLRRYRRDLIEVCGAAVPDAGAAADGGVSDRHTGRGLRGADQRVRQCHGHRLLHHDTADGRRRGAGRGHRGVHQRAVHRDHVRLVGAVQGAGRVLRLKKIQDRRLSRRSFSLSKRLPGHRYRREGFCWRLSRRSLCCPVFVRADGRRRGRSHSPHPPQRGRERRQ